MTAARSSPRDQRAAVIAGVLGWTLDAFDFFLVVMTLTAIGREVGRSDSTIAFSLLLTLLFLPPGAFVGCLLAALCYAFVFPHWGWRPLFLLGGAPALLALFVRARVEESEVWRTTRQESWAGLGRAIRDNLGLFLYLTALMWMMNLVSHGTQDLYPTFLERYWGFGFGRRVALTAFSMVGAVMGGIVCGLYSIRLGRRRTIAMALAGATAVISAWAFAPSLAVLVAGTFLMQAFVQGAWGVIPAHITELSPDSARGFLPG